MVRIITDSAADFEPHELQQMNITCIPLKIMMGDQEYEENVNLSKPQFFELLRQLDGAPKTSQASPQILLDLLRHQAHMPEDASLHEKVFTLIDRLTALVPLWEMDCNNRKSDAAQVSSNAMHGLDDMAL